MFIKTVVLGTLFSLALWLSWLLVVYLVVQTDRACAGGDRTDAARSRLRLRSAGPWCADGHPRHLVRRGHHGPRWVGRHHTHRRATGVEGGSLVLANVAGFGVWAIVMSLLATGSNQIAAPGRSSLSRSGMP